MEIILAKSAGFCYGVDRAVDIALDRAGKTKNVYTSGPIIHNSQMVEFLENKGVKAIDDISKLNEGDIIIIRAHGVTSEQIEMMEKKGLIVYDATCPYVKKIHNIVKNECKNKIIIIIGDKMHAEVIGIRGHCIENTIVINSVEEAKALDLEGNDIAVVAQTTIIIEKWNDIIEILENKYQNVQKFDTICSATAKRQSEAKEIASVVDLMIIIGGKNSSNTQKLTKVCKMYCSKTYQIEICEDLKSIDFKEIQKVGITAGASTPEWIIKEVVSKMEEIKNVNLENAESIAEQAAEVIEKQAEEVVEKQAAEVVEKQTEEVIEKQAEEVVEKQAEEVIDMAKAYEDSMVSIRANAIVTGKIMGYNTSEVYVDIGYKADGIIKLDEFLVDSDFDPEKELIKGKEIEVFVVKINDGEGNVQLSQTRVDEIRGLEELTSAYREKKALDVKIIEITKGGALANYRGISLFIPASQISDRYEKDLEKYLNTTLKVQVTEVNKRKRRYIASSRIIIETEKKLVLKEFWDNIEEGKLYKGTVKSLTDFGAFVDLGGVDGLVHISELSWIKVKHPKDVVSVGDELEVTIKSFDKEKSRISLGYRKEKDNPWSIAKNKYSVNDIVKAKVIRLVPFGAFIELEKGIDALVHISQISNKRIIDAKEVLEIGQEVEGKIIELDFELKKISISIKDVNPIDPPESEEEKEHKKTAKFASKGHTEEMGVNIGELLKEKDVESDEK